MSDEPTNPAVYDTVIRFTVKQGIEDERCPSAIDDTKKHPTKKTDVAADDFKAYYYFPSGELIYTRDTGRLFIGNNTYPEINAGSISESGISNQITPGGVLVGNKYLGSFSDLAFDDKHFKFSEYNSNTDAYNGDYRFDAKSSILYLYDTNVEAPTLTTKALSNVHSTSAISGLLNRLTEGGTRNFIPFFNFIPDGRTLDIDEKYEDNTFSGNKYKFKILKVVNIKPEPVHQWFDHSKTTNTKDNKVTTDFFVDGNKLKLRLNETILKNLYKRTGGVGFPETEKHRVVITDNNGNLHIYTTISKLELDKLNGLANYRRYDLNNNKSMSYIGLNQHIGQPFYVGTANTTVNKGKYNEETYRTTYIKGSHIARDEKMSSKWNTAYSTLWSNIGTPEWVDGTNKGSIWNNIGQSVNYVGESGHGGRNSVANQAPTAGLAHFDHNINSNGKAAGNVIDIWYNIGDPLAHATIWKYENGKRTNIKDVSGNVVPVTSGYSSGYRYQNLWESIGARKQSATNAKHYNLWNHIGDNTSYITKFSDLSWPASTAKPIPTVISKDYSLSSLKTTIWGAMNYVRTHINDLYGEIRTACSKLISYTDTKINDLKSYVDGKIADITNSLSKLKTTVDNLDVGIPDWSSVRDYTMALVVNLGQDDTYFFQQSGWLLIYSREDRRIKFTINNSPEMQAGASRSSKDGEQSMISTIPVSKGDKWTLKERHGIQSDTSDHNFNILFLPLKK